MPKWIYLCLLYIGIFCVSGTHNMNQIISTMMEIQQEKKSTKCCSSDSSKEIPEDQQEESKDGAENDSKLFSTNTHSFVLSKYAFLVERNKYIITNTAIYSSPGKDLVTPPPNTLRLG